MTVYVKIGRRVPRAWFKRQANKVKGLMSFQENIWIIVKQSLQLAKKKANYAQNLDFILEYDNEVEDLHYQLEWIKVTICGSKKAEEEEYNDTMKLYSKMGKIMKKEMPKDKNLSKHFKTKILNSKQVEDAYQQGYGAVDDKSMANKLLEMGILTHVEKIDDFNNRDKVYVD